MSKGELSFLSPPSLFVKWTIPDFFRLYAESEYSLRSPDFTSADGRHCLRLFQTRNFLFDCIGIDLLSTTDTDPGRALLYEVRLKSGNEEIDMDRRVSGEVFWISRSKLESDRDLYVAGGTLTLLCSVRPRRQNSVGTPKSGGAQTRDIPKYRIGGKLTFESPPFLYVAWRIPGFFELSRQSVCTIESPEFLFSNRPYRLRLLSYVAGVDIHLVNLSDADPGRYVSYEVGLKSTTGEEIHTDYYDAPSTREFHVTRSKLDRKISGCFPDGHLTVFCCMRSRGPSSEGSPRSGGPESPGWKAPVPQAAARPNSIGVQTSNEEEDKEGLPKSPML